MEIVLYKNSKAWETGQPYCEIFNEDGLSGWHEGESPASESPFWPVLLGLTLIKEWKIMAVAIVDFTKKPNLSPANQSPYKYRLLVTTLPKKRGRGGRPTMHYRGKSQTEVLWYSFILEGIIRDEVFKDKNALKNPRFWKNRFTAILKRVKKRKIEEAQQEIRELKKLVARYETSFGSK